MVAIKKLHPHLHDPDSLEHFVSEIRTIGHLEHPNIIPIHDVGLDEDNRYYFVMKYITGETLGEVIRHLKSGDPEYHRLYTSQKRIEIFSEILKAIHFAHNKGIIHRDLKPDNIMIGNYGEVTVMDWGIARPVNSRQADLARRSQIQEEITIYKSGTDPATRIYTDSRHNSQKITIGTPLYMPPEQIDNEPEYHDQRSDIYSLSALFYEFLTLQPPIQPGRTLHQTFQNIYRQTPRLAMMVRNKFQPPPPADLSHLVARGLKKNPDHRFQSVTEMQELLSKIAGGYTPIQCPFTFSKRIASSIIHLVNRTPMLGLAAFTLLVILLFLGIYFLLTMIL
jgi:serine/threonine-protein kinase